MGNNKRFSDWQYPKIEERKPTKYNWVVQNKDGLRLGYKTDIGAFTYINAKYDVTIEDFVQIGSHCSIYSISTIDEKIGAVTLKKGCRAGSHSVVMPGGRPVMADVDPISQNITAALSPRTKGIVVVNLAGWPCDMDPIMNLAREKGLWVVEDCAQANGATYKGRQVGSMGDVAAFSFCQDKIITTGGEGGMVTTNRHDIWNKIWSHKDHGKSFDAVYHREHQPGFHWLHESFGTNWRMTEMQAAIGRVQLRKLPQWLTLRRRNAAVLTDGFSRIPGLRLTIPPQEIEHAYYKYYVFVEPEALKSDWSRDRIMTALMAEGIPCGSGSCSEIYLEKAFEGNGLRPAERLPVAQELGETSLMFMVHPTLSVDDMEDVVRAMDKVMSIAVR